MVNCVIVQQGEGWNGQMPNGINISKRFSLNEKIVHSTTNQRKVMLVNSENYINDLKKLKALSHFFLIVLPPLPGKSTTLMIRQSQRKCTSDIAYFSPATANKNLCTDTAFFKKIRNPTVSNPYKRFQNG